MFGFEMNNFILLVALAGTLQAAPKIEVVGQNAVDLKTYPANETKTATFTIKNSGDEPLVIKALRKNCGCFRLSCDKKSLKPDESVEVKVDVLAYGIYKSYGKNVFVYTNDPKQRVTKLLVSGNAEPLAEVMPKDKLFVGTVGKDRELTREFVIKPFGKKKFQLKDPVVESSHPLKATLTEDDGVYRLKVAYEANRKLGRFKSTVKLPVLEPQGWKPFEVTLYGRVK